MTELANLVGATGVPHDMFPSQGVSSSSKTRKLFLVNRQNGLKKQTSFNEDQEVWDVMETGRHLLGIPKLSPIHVQNISEKEKITNSDMTK